MRKEQGITQSERPEQEIAELEDLMLSPLGSKEDRLGLEVKLLPKLEKASNEAILFLQRYNHKRKYAGEEFERRVNEGVAFDLNDLWRLASQLGGLTLRSKSEQGKYNFFSEAFANSVPEVDRGEMADFIARKISSQVDLNTTLLKDAVSYREDIVDVVEEARIIASNSDEIFRDDYLFASLYHRAKWFREEREEMNSPQA